MIVGALYGVQAIPRRWLAALEPAVAATCRSQARALLLMSPHCRSVVPQVPR
jgi:ADP-ribosyl-[dinitrogen reductase] hydrolase